MSTDALYPVLMVDRPAECAAFYRELLGMTTTFEADWYVSLAGEAGAQIAFVDRRHDSVPAAIRDRPAGVLVTVEVSDARAIAARAAHMGVDVLLELRDEAWGQRHFICRGPAGLAVDVVEIIAPSAEYAALYDGDHLPAG